MKVVTIKRFVSPVYGNIDAGLQLEVDERTAQVWLTNKLANAVPEITETPAAEPVKTPRKRGSKADDAASQE